MSMSLLRMRVWARSIRRSIPAIMIPRLLLLLPLWRLLPRLSLVSFPASVASVVGATAPLAVVHPTVVRPRCRRWCPRRRGCVRRGGHNIVATTAFAAAAASVAVVIPLRAVAFKPSPSVVIVVPVVAPAVLVVAMAVLRPPVSLLPFPPFLGA